MKPFKKIRLIAAALLLVLCSAASAEETAASSVPDPNLSLEIVNVEIMDVLKLISKKAGLNIVAGKEIQGQVSIFLKEVPVREGLKTILQSQGLAF